MNRSDLIAHRVAATTLVAVGLGSIAWILLIFRTMEIRGASVAEKLARILGFPFLLTIGALLLPIGVVWLLIVQKRAKN